jgi:hypothetical protein
MSNARDRRRRPGRPKAFREPKPRFLVVTEGKVTEREYLNGLNDICRNVLVEVAPGGGADPKKLVEFAKQRKTEAEGAARGEDPNLAYEEVWCVFDIDEWPNVGEARQMAQSGGIRLAISNPRFELWLLLHFQDSPGQQHGAKMTAMLKKRVPEYDKHVDYAKHYSAGYQQAVVRATRMDEAADEAGESGRNPTTGVYRLTELIRGESTTGQP